MIPVESKIVFIDGNLQNGLLRIIRGNIIEDTGLTLTIKRSNGTLTIGKNFLVKIEKWE